MVVLKGLHCIRFSIQSRNTNSKVINLANHKKRKQYKGPIRNRSKRMLLALSAEKRERGTIGFSFASHWLRNWREFFKLITERSKTKLGKREISFDTQLKTALNETTKVTVTGCEVKYSSSPQCNCAPHSGFWPHGHVFQFL